MTETTTLERQTQILEEELHARVQAILDETEFEFAEHDYTPDPYLYILGLDPGGTTGVACLRIDTRDDTINPELVYLHQVADGRYGFKDFFGDTQVVYNVIIVSEKWRERNIKGANREPQYIEGLMHMLWGDENIEYQYPDVKELVPDSWLKENNLWTEGHRHQMDALKHAFAYLRNDGHSATVESLSGASDKPMAEEGEADEAQLGEEAKSAMEAMAEAADGAAEAIQALIDALGEGGEGGESAEGAGEPSEGSQEGTGQSAERQTIEYKETDPGQGPSGENNVGQRHDIVHESTGERKRRERNGAFAGFEPEDFEEGTSLLED